MEMGLEGVTAMKTILGWIGKHWLKTLLIIIGILLALVIPPLIIHAMYKTVARNPYYESTWSSGDLITYVAGFEAFLGTVFLGIVAIRQNDKSIGINSRLVDIEEKNSLLARHPNIEFQKQETQSVKLCDVLDQRYIIFCSKEVADIFRSCLFTSESLYLYRFLLSNRSLNGVKIKFLSLKLSAFWQESSPILYEEIPSELPIKSIDLASGKEEYIGFIIDPSLYKELSAFQGEIIISATNYALEEFHYKIDFVVSVESNIALSKVFQTEISHEQILSTP